MAGFTWEDIKREIIVAPEASKTPEKKPEIKTPSIEFVDSETVQSASKAG